MKNQTNTIQEPIKDQAYWENEIGLYEQMMDALRLAYSVVKANHVKALEELSVIVNGSDVDV